MKLEEAKEKIRIESSDPSANEKYKGWILEPGDCFGVGYDPDNQWCVRCSILSSIDGRKDQLFVFCKELTTGGSVKMEVTDQEVKEGAADLVMEVAKEELKEGLNRAVKSVKKFKIKPEKVTKEGGASMEKTLKGGYDKAVIKKIGDDFTEGKTTRREARDALMALGYGVGAANRVIKKLIDGVKPKEDPTTATM